MKRGAGIAVGLATVFLGGIFTGSMAEAKEGDAAAGEARYAQTCVNCHGPGGKGMASFPKIGGKDVSFITMRLEQYRAGEMVGPNSALMIPMATDLSDAEIANIAAYLSSLEP
ncbi:MAG: c-type cytochrome [Pseudomonadota bacterium]